MTVSDLVGREQRTLEPAAKVKARSGKFGLFLDKFCGTIVLAGACLLNRRRALPSNPRHIGFSVLGAIGDTLMASAIMADVRRALPDIRITLIVSSTNRPIADLLPMVNDVITVPVNRPDLAAKAIRAAGLDLLIDCNQWIRISAIHSAFADCYTIGFRTKGQHRHFAYDFVVPHRRSYHEIDNFRALLAPLNIVPSAPPTVVFRPEIPAEFLTPSTSSGTILFHPWAGGAKGIWREWPNEYWIELGRSLQNRNYTLLVTGGPGDAALSDGLVTTAQKAGVTLTSIAGRVSLHQLSALLAEAAVVVSVNTGIMHLAAAVGARLVALNGPVDPVRWGPLSENAISIAPETGGGYLYLGFEHRKGMPSCMTAISPATTLEAVLKILAQPKLKQRETVL